MGQGLIDKVDRALTFAIEVEHGLTRGDITNYDELRMDIVEKLEKLRDAPIRTEEPRVYGSLNTTPPSTTQHQHSTTQHRTAPHSTAQHRTAPHSTAQHCLTTRSSSRHVTAPHTCLAVVTAS
jgi:hypothetical protein